jgi:hypothetical protein
MSFSVDEFLDRTFNLRNYNCWHFACEVWEKLTGQTINAQLNGLRQDILQNTVDGHADRLTKLDTPLSPCLVLMRRSKSLPHVGVFIHGRVLHLNEEGVWCQPLTKVSVGFTEIDYYR